MKLRLQGDSVRLRLSRDEVDALGAGRPLESITRFFQGELKVRIEPGPAWDASFAGGILTVRTPDASPWAADPTVEGIYASQGDTTIAIEKDYACLHRDAAGNVGTFPNPALAMKE